MDVSTRTTMSGRERNVGHGGSGYIERRQRREKNNSRANITSKKGLWTDLVNNVFYYGYKEAAGQMIISWEKLVRHVGTNYGKDISKKLNSKIKVNIVTPLHSPKVLVSHATKESLVHVGQSNIQAACRTQASIPRSTATADPVDADLPIKIVIMYSNVDKGENDLSNKNTIEI